MVNSYKELDVWKKSMTLTDKVFDITEGFPQEQKYVLAQQLQKAVVSVPSNIAEGAGRNNTGEYIHFLGIAKGSLAEVETQLFIAEMRNYISKIQLEEFESLSNDIDAMLFNLIRSLNQRR